MKLLELYSLATGLRIGQQYLVESFYPLPFDRYITLQGGSGMAAKNYPRYVEVLAMILPALKAAGIEVVQLGGKDDPAIPGCYHTQGKTTLHQSNHLLRRSLCHVGNDSWLSHRGGEMGVPLVIVFGPTTPENHGPYRFNSEKSAFIESHRFGRRPTFASQEFPSTIAVIPPERVASQVLSILGLSATITRRSLYFGDTYQQGAVELIPNCIVGPQIQIPGALVVRMDHAGTDLAAAENVMLSNMQIRPCSVITNREINLNLLAQVKPRLAGLRVEVDNVSAAWIKAVKRLGINAAFFSSERDPEKLAQRRLDLYDASLFDHFTAPTREDFVKGARVYTNDNALDPVSMMDRLWFRSSKLTLSDNKLYLSLAHWRAGLNTPNSDQNWAKVIDDPMQWEDLSYHYFYTE